jgi:hypothetical protein
MSSGSGCRSLMQPRHAAVPRTHAQPECIVRALLTGVENRVQAGFVFVCPQRRARRTTNGRYGKPESQRSPPLRHPLLPGRCRGDRGSRSAFAHPFSNRPTRTLGDELSSVKFPVPGIPHGLEMLVVRLAVAPEIVREVQHRARQQVPFRPWLAGISGRAPRALESPIYGICEVAGGDQNAPVRALRAPRKRKATTMVGRAVQATSAGRPSSRPALSLARRRSEASRTAWTPKKAEAATT